jgi:hypothetical protein
MYSQETEMLLRVCKSMRGFAVRIGEPRITGKTTNERIHARDAHKLAAAVDLAAAIDMGNPVFIVGAMRAAEEAMEMQ